MTPIIFEIMVIFKTCRLEPTHTETPCGGRKNNNSATDFILSSIGVPDVEDFDFLDEDDTIIQYFSLVIYYILLWIQCMIG